MSDFKHKEILQTLVSEMKNISANVFTSNRPKSVTEDMQEFIVVSLPNMMYRKTYGEGYGLTASYIRIEIYVRDVNGVEWVAKLDSIKEQIVARFPIVTDFITISNPRVALTGDDGYGFHVWNIQASFITK